MQILFERYPELVDEVKIPHKKFSHDGGIDFQIFGIGPALSINPDDIPPLILPDQTIVLEPFCTYKTFCGIRIKIPEGYTGLFLPRSSARRKGLVVSSVWDANYTGWVCPFITATQNLKIKRGERLFQLILLSIPFPNFKESDFEVIETDRGGNGIGSTGRF